MEVTPEVRWDGKLKIVDKLASFYPAKSRKKAGEMKGKKGITPTVIPFHANTLSTFRKVHDNRERIDSNCANFTHFIPAENSHFRTIVDSEGGGVAEWPTLKCLKELVALCNRFAGF